MKYKKEDKIEEKEFDPMLVKESKKKNIRKTSKKKKLNINIIPQDTTEMILTIVFLALLIFTIILGFKVNNLKAIQREEVNANIILPVLEKESFNEISVDISNMKKDETKEYVFKISNSKNNSINNEEIKYNIELENNTDLEIEVLKNDEKISLTNNELLDNYLIKDAEQIDTFKLIIKAKKKIKDKELLQIKVRS